MTQDTSRWKRIAISLGALLVVACSVDVRMIGDAMIEGGTVLRDATRSDAAAQADTCTQWELTTWRAGEACDLGFDHDATDICPVPAGWEPWQMEYTDLSGEMVLRRCVR